MTGQDVRVTVRGVDPAWSDLSETSRRVVLHLLRRGATSRTDLARSLGLSTASLTRLTSPLVESGLLVEKARYELAGTPGRPQVPLDVNGDIELFLGVSITRDDLNVVLTDIHARVLDHRRQPTRDLDPAAAVAQAGELIGHLVAALPAGRDDLVSSAGVAIGGSVRDGRTVTRAPFLEWSDVPLAELMAGATGLRTLVGNDLTALVHAENWFGAGRAHRQFVVVTTGVGVGYGAVVAGEAIAGPDEGAGLAARALVTGFEGTPEPVFRVLSEISLAERATQVMGRPASMEEALAAAGSGDAAASELVAAAVSALGEFSALAAAFTLTDTVVISGESARMATLAPAALTAGIARIRPDDSPLNVIVRPHDFAFWAQGAAALAIRDRVLGRADDSTGA